MSNQPADDAKDEIRDQGAIWTIGHSTRTVEEFVELLREHEIRVLVDVRTFPGSRRYPHFNKENLSKLLESVGVEYRHMPELGGRRKPRPDSNNTAWRNDSFRGYADYMETEDFKKGIENLLEVSAQRQTAVMCAEAVWWRCHRSLIADFLKAKGLQVTHILAAGKIQSHPYTPVARIVDGQLTYRGLLEG